MTTAENEGFFGLQHENVIQRGDSPLVEAPKIWQGVYLRGFIPEAGEGEIIKFLKHIVQKHTQVKPQNFLNDWQAIAGFIGKQFKKTSLVNKKVHLLQILIANTEKGQGERKL